MRFYVVRFKKALYWLCAILGVWHDTPPHQYSPCQVFEINDY